MAFITAHGIFKVVVLRAEDFFYLVPRSQMISVYQTIGCSLQHLLFSPATIPGNPGRLVAGDDFPGRHVTREKSNGKTRMGYLPGR
uniref:Uncharacterized protein n=1 Tax=Tanacetum cinerariifolium TaxID=118510 RepID=A0A699QCK5_TANCI|nr:hypothetical protein [Tanacetum cinerariifolium]